MNTAKVINAAKVNPLHAELDALHASKHGPDCSSCALPPELLEAVRYGRNVRRLSYAQLSDFLKGKGQDVTEQALARHYRRHEGKPRG